MRALFISNQIRSLSDLPDCHNHLAAPPSPPSPNCRFLLNSNKIATLLCQPIFADVSKKLEVNQITDPDGSPPATVSWTSSPSTPTLHTPPLGINRQQSLTYPAPSNFVQPVQRALSADIPSQRLNSLHLNTPPQNTTMLHQGASYIQPTSIPLTNLQSLSPGTPLTSR